MSKALVVSYYTIQDLATGGKRRVDELVRALLPSVSLLQPKPAHPVYPCHTFPLDFGRRKRLINWGIFNFYWPTNRSAAQSVINSVQPDVIIIDSIWCYRAVANLGPPILLDAQNVDALAIAERFGPRHPFTRLVTREEAYVARSVQHLFCCSDIDADLMRNRYGVPGEKISMSPNGVRVAASDAQDPAADAVRREHHEKVLLLFMGKLDYAPNVEALEFLDRVVLPELEKRHPGRFHCVVTGGPGLPAHIHHPMIHYAGRVADVAPWLNIADICLAPLFSGSGTRIKILEYLGAGKPVVATPKAAEGIEVVHQRDLLLADASNFASAVLTMADDPAKAASMAAHGTSLVQNRYSWDHAAAVWREGVRKSLMA